MADKLWGKVPFLLITFSAVMVVRCFAIFYFAANPSAIRMDALQYQQIAINIIDGLGFSCAAQVPTALASPGQPLFLALIFGIFGKSVLIAQIGQAVLSSLTVVFCILIFEMLFPEHLKYRRLLLLILIVHPHLNYYATVLMSETLFIFFVVLSLYFTIYSWRSESRTVVLLAGVFSGAALMTRANIVFFIPFILLWYLFMYRGVMVRRLFLAFLYGAGVFMMMLPWMVRNYVTFDAFVPLTTRGGHSFFTRGFNPMNESERKLVTTRLWQQRLECTKRFHQGADILEAFAPMLSFRTEDLTALYPEKYRERFAGLSEIEAEKLYYTYVKEVINNNPAQMVRFFVSNTLHFWDIFGDQVPDKRRFNVFWVFFIPFIIIGMMISRAQWKMLLPVYGLCLSFSILFAIAGAENRYRLPLEPLLLLFTGPAVAYLSRCQRRKIVSGFLFIWSCVTIGVYLESEWVFQFLKKFF